MIVLECLKAQLNQGRLPNLYFFRDSNGLEVDILWQNGRDLVPVEIKASATFHTSLLKGLKRFQKVATCDSEYLVYAGESKTMSDHIELVRFDEVSRIFQSNSSAGH